MSQNPSCIDWWRITIDLQSCGLSLQRISEEALIPKSTIGWIRNHEAEPRHRDGETLLAVWRRFMPDGTDIPMRPCPLRQSDMRKLKSM